VGHRPQRTPLLQPHRLLTRDDREPIDLVVGVVDVVEAQHDIVDWWQHGLAHRAASPTRVRSTQVEALRAQSAVHRGGVLTLLPVVSCLKLCTVRSDRRNVRL
jgi:hypothetical protein